MNNLYLKCIEIICIYMFLNNCNTMNTRLLYSYLYNCIRLVFNQQLIKSIPRILIFVRYLYYILTPYITNNMVQHEGCILPILTDFDFLTNHSSMKLLSFLQIERNLYTTNSDYLTKHISL